MDTGKCGAGKGRGVGGFLSKFIVTVHTCILHEGESSYCVGRSGWI